MQSVTTDLREVFAVLCALATAFCASLSLITVRHEIHLDAGAEIDACRPADPGRFVEIKTTRLVRDAKVCDQACQSVGSSCERQCK